MSEPTVQDQAAPPRRRWLPRLLAGGVLVVALLLGLWAYVDYAWDRDLREAVAEADRLDPGWRFDDLEKARPSVPDAENGATLVLAARTGMPAKWLATAPGAPPGLGDRLADLPPPRRPDAADLKELRVELDKVAKAVDTARGLAGRPRGRYDVAWTEDLIGTLVPHVQETRVVVRLLALDALLQACDGDGAAALGSCRAALSTGRSLGDEPLAISQVCRVGCVRRAVGALEQVLGLGETPAADLELMQRLLLEEADEPLQLIAARADRVAFYQSLDAMRTGRFRQAAYGVTPSMLGSTGDDLLNRGRARAGEVAYLRYHNELVEIAKLPAHEQQDRLARLHRPEVQLPKLLEGLSRDDDQVKMARWFHRHKAELLCAAAALAVERYRLARGHWPERLEDLVPDYLAAVPADPFDGRPLRLRRLPDGIVVYSVGPDRQDDSGKLDRSQPGAPGTDVGFRLWDTDRRGKTPGQE